jgi:HPt (histidine-containing phosphotransfer) domain-containing protein
MSATEFEEWTRARIAGLDAFMREAQRYRSGRNWPGNETNRTNQIYDAFLSEAADLLAALEEMRAAAEKEAQQQP